MFIKAAFCQGQIEEVLAPFKDKPFSVFVENRPTDQELSINPTNFYITWEPDEYFGSATWVAHNYQKFTYVFGWNEEILEKVPNAFSMVFGTSAFFDKEDINEEFDYNDKLFKVTFIRGNKLFNVPGHRMRWNLLDNKEKIKNIPVEFYAQTTPPYASTPEEDIQWFAQRKHIFKEPMFHVAIENTFHNNYFTEKIMDCFLFRTAPIYWGCPNISKFFNPRGIIQVEDVDDIIYRCNNLTKDVYEDMLPAMEDNYYRAKRYMNLGKNILNTVHPRLRGLGII